LLEGGAGIRTIQDLLGYKDLKTTMVYTHVANLAAVQSPLECIRANIKHTKLVESRVRQHSVTGPQPFRKVDMGNIVTLVPKNGNGI
jgi:hypothetical protein